jgi:hypothetical protein
MISEHTVMNAQTRTLVTDTWLSTFSRRSLNAVETSLARVTRNLHAWASAPVLPHAALWEAALVVDLVNNQRFDEPAVSTTEPPFLTDAWLRH